MQNFPKFSVFSPTKPQIPDECKEIEYLAGTKEDDDALFIFYNSKKKNFCAISLLKLIPVDSKEEEEDVPVKKTGRPKKSKSKQ